MVRLFGARSALPRRPVSFSPCSRARRRQALVRWSPPRRFEARRFWGLGSLPLPRAGRGHISSSNANLSRRSRPRRAVVTATACAGFRRHRGVHTKVGITFLLSLWAGAEHRSWPRGGFLLNPRRSRLPGIPAEAGAVGAVSRGERACSLPVTRTRVRAGVAPRGCPVREGVERVVSVYLRDGVDESRPSTSTAKRRWG